MDSANGIPLLGFGTWPLKDDDVERCVGMALEVGFRHVDTAQMYGNEKQVGRALKASGVPRRDLHVVTKVDSGNMGAKTFRPSVEKSVGDLSAHRQKAAGGGTRKHGGALGYLIAFLPPLFG